MAANSRLIGSLLLLALLAPSCARKSSSKTSGPTPGPAAWYSQYRQPTSSNLHAVRAADANTVIVAGDATSIFRSDDGGQTWVQLEHRPAFRGGDILSMDFVGSNLECVGTDSTDTTKGRVWTAINGVLDFTTPDLPATVAAYSSVDVVAIDTSYRLRADGIVEKEVAGTPPVVTTLPALPAGTWRSIFFFSSGDGYAAGDGGLVAKFTASLGSWSPQTTPPPPGPSPQYNLKMIFFTDSLHGYASGDQASIIGTSNGGSSWQSLNYSSGGVTLRSLHFPVDSTTGWIVGDSGTIVKTTTSGASWTAEVSPMGFIEDNNDVWFVDNSNGYIVGTHGIVLRTTNGGTTWLRAPTLPTGDPLIQLNGVDFSNNGSLGLAVGVGGAVLRTMDGGSSWVALAGNPSSADLYGVAIPKTGSGTVAYVCGASGTILQISSLTTAPTFTDQTTGTNAFRAILFPSGDTIGWACGDGSGTLLHTNNGGTSWTPAAAPVPAAANWKALSADVINVYAAGDGGVVASSGNFGASWTNLSLPTTPTINSFQSPIGTGALFAGASDSKVYEYFGVWMSTTLPSGAPLSISFPDASNGWVVNNQPPFAGGVFYTANGGGAWTHLYVHTKWQLRAIWMSPSIPGLGFVVGDNGTILKTTSGGL